ELKNARGANAVRAVDQPLAPLALQQGALLGRDHGRESNVIIGRERPIVGDRDPEAVDRAAAVVWREHAGLALHRRIGRRHVRQVSQWDADKFESGVLEIQHLLVLIVDDARRLHLPFRRFPGILYARLAGGIDAVVEHGEIARTLRARRGEASLLGRIESQGIYEAVAIVVAEIHDFAVSDRAVTLGQLYISFGMQALGFLV